MDDIQNKPQYIDSESALTSDDPQSQVASQGWQQIGQSAPVQQAIDVQGNLDRYNDILNRSIAGDKNARMELAQHSLGTVMGTLRGPEPVVGAPEPTTVPMYSKLGRTVEQKMGGSATPEQIRGMLKEIKGDEKTHYGLEDFLAGKTKVSKDEMLSHVKDNDLKINTIVKGGPPADVDKANFIAETMDEGFTREEALQQFEDQSTDVMNGHDAHESGTKFSQYTLPGGENYKETLYTLPIQKKTIGKDFQSWALDKYGDRFLDMSDAQLTKVGEEYKGLVGKRQGDPNSEYNKEDAYRSSHYDEPNILAHTRTNERIGPDGKKHLFIEEIQSDWHQAGRKKGYKDNGPVAMPEGFEMHEAEAGHPNNKFQLFGADGRIAGVGPTADAALKDYSRVSNPHAVPDAPFKTTWHEYALKRLIKDAVEGGHDHISWTTGEQQAARYDLSKQVDNISAFKHPDGTFTVEATKTFGGQPSIVAEHENISSKDLEGIVGKDLASKITNESGQLEKGSGYRNYSGVDLKVGGEGMKGFYDKMVPDFMSKFGKKYGSKVEKVDLGNHEKWHVWDNKNNEALIEANSREDAEDTIKTMFDGNKNLVAKPGTLGGDASGNTVHTMKITPEMRKALLKEGLPTFQHGGVVGRQNYADGGVISPQTLQPQTLAPAPPGLEEFLAQPDATAPPPGLEDFIASDMKEAQYGTPGQQLKAGAESLAQGIAGPAAPQFEKKYLGVKAEDIRNRAKVNSGIHMTGEIAGLISPAFLPGGTATGIGRFTQSGLLEAAGKATAGILARPTTLSGKVGVAAAKAAVENMLLAGSDETSKIILNDPNTSAEHAIANIGLSGVLGGIVGGTIGSISPLLKGPMSKAGQIVEDFKSRIAEHTANPDPAATMNEELTNFFNETNKISHETFGHGGIKSEAIHKLMPEMTDTIAKQANGITDSLDAGLQKLAENRDPHAPLLQDKIQRFKQSLNSDDPATIFDGIQTLKQQLQAESKYIEGMTPLSERPYRNTVKNLAHDLRTSLEDRTVWGKAGDVQASINSATSKYLAATKDFRSLMTTKVMGESTIDPGKINTYLNQVGKANAEIKQDKLRNFLDHGEEFKAAVAKAYDTIGAESPIQNTSLNYTLSTLGKKTAGSKLADIFIKKGLTDVGGQAMGATVGGTLGHAMGGHGAIGALIGQHALGPFFSSVLPAIAKAITSNPSSAGGFKAAVDHGLAVAKSEAVLTKAAKSIFKVGSSDVLPGYNSPNTTNISIKQREKLDRLLKAIQQSPAAMLNSTDKTSHYLPAHAQAMSQAAMNATNYLNGLRSDTDKKSPLDSKPTLSAPQKAAFNNALDIANKPSIIFDKIKTGSLTTNDITSLHTMYPALYESMKSKVMSEIITSENKDKPIPYKIRQSLSLFLGQPLDSTMTPSSIMAIQATTQSGKKNTQDQQQAPSAPKRSTSSLTKMPGMYKTPAQTTEGRRTREN